MENTGAETAETVNPCRARFCSSMEEKEELEIADFAELKVATASLVPRS